MTTVMPERPAVSGPERARTWLRKIIGGGQIIETCPSWCVLSHDGDDHGHLDDLVHWAPEVSMTLPITVAGAGFDNWPVLAAQIQVDPYSEDTARSVPHVVFSAAPDDMTDALDPDRFAQVIAQIRSHCEELDKVYAHLIATRAAATGAAR